jgi:hypothetical protein
MTLALRSATAIRSFRRRALFGFLAVLAACAPGEPKDSLGPDGAESVQLTAEKQSLLVGESSLLRVSVQSPSGQQATEEAEWTSNGGTLVALSDSTARFSSVSAGSFWIWWCRRFGCTPKDSTIIVVNPPVLQAVILTPASAALATGATQQFSVSGQWSNGTTTAPAVTYSATGGSVSSGGLYTAGSAAGNFRVIAVQQGGTLADSSVVTLTTTAPVLQAVILTPASAALATGATQQFSVSGQWSNGTTTAPAVTYSATGGSVSSGGLYTAGSAAGTFRVIAVQQGGTLADSSVVTLTSAAPGSLSGLDFPGNVNFPSPSPSSILTWNQSRSGTAPFPAYPATYIWRVYPRANKNAYGSFWTFMFHARYQTSEFNQSSTNEYYGMHPYPDPSNGTNKWEISNHGGDEYRDPVTFNQWYTQVVVVYESGGREYHTYYWNWPNTTTALVSANGNSKPAASDPAIIIGDAPWNPGKEIPNAILRGFQYYDVVLTPAQIAQEIASPGSVRTPWYLNLNPTPSDVSDKSGNGHHPAWVGSGRPAVWTGN